jgi:L-alanine-DL-glutamate epimerase-like enolase superfamily enzyme
MPRLHYLFEETPAIEDGKIVVPKRPGLGLRFDQAALEKYTVA